jgi:sterol desaturase/sphingolipid hydroxylase (fatty acid hydroxylase superfamily)
VPNYIAFAVPFFFALMAVELWAARRKGLALYRFDDAVADLSTGMTQQVALLFFKKAGLFAAYLLVYRHRVLDLRAGSALTWAVAIVLVDLAYYWWHRLSHEVSVLWAAHIVHHSSEDYNLAVALRQSVLTPWTVVPFHLPLALLGVPPLVMLAVDSFNTLYQFWIHTQLVGKMGFLERWLNTPALHRVHHGVNPRYLDKNFGGTFIVWDRLFGTYEPETEPPVYGIVKPLMSFDPFVAQFHYWGELWRRARATPRLADRLRVFLRPPDWTPPGLPPPKTPPEVRPETFVKYDRPVDPSVARYVFVEMATVVAGATALMFYESALPVPVLAAGAVLVLLAPLAWGGFFEGRRWAARIAFLRLGLIAAAAFAWALQTKAALPLAGSVFSAAMGLWLARLRVALPSLEPSLAKAAGPDLRPPRPRPG